MPADRFAFRFPKQCPNCGPDAAASIKFEQTIKGQLIHLRWQCGLCGVHWPIDFKLQGDRRVGERRIAMRKLVSAKERRRA